MNKRQDNWAKYIIVCDESSRKGRCFSYFYGGAIVAENKYEKISNVLDDYKAKFGLHELKRTKITEKNYKQYIDVIDLFFTFVKSGDIKVRVMFAPNDQLERLPKEQNATYSKFYNTFIVNAFSVFYAGQDIKLRLIFDDLPETKEQIELFKTLLEKKINYDNSSKHKNRVQVNHDRIEEVDSRKHVVLQCVDVITGLIDFYINTPLSEIKNSKRATAKNKVFLEIKKQIEEIHENFEFLDTTWPIWSTKGWKDCYKHFVYKKK